MASPSRGAARPITATPKDFDMCGITHDDYNIGTVWFDDIGSTLAGAIVNWCPEDFDELQHGELMLMLDGHGGLFELEANHQMIAAICRAADEAGTAREVNSWHVVFDDDGNPMMANYPRITDLLRVGDHLAITWAGGEDYSVTYR